MSTTPQTPEERFRQEAQELYPLSDSPGAARFNEIQTARRNAHIKSYSRLKAELDRLKKENEELKETSGRLLRVIGFGFAQQNMFSKEYLQLESLIISPPKQ